MDPKLEIQVEIIGECSVIFTLKKLSRVISEKDKFTPLYISLGGYIIKSALRFKYTPLYLLLPTYESISEKFIDEASLSCCHIFLNDKERKKELEKLFNCLGDFSKSEVFKYNKEGHVGMVKDKWLIY